MSLQAPEIAVKHGMTKLVFEDDFESLDTIDVENTGKEGYKWYVERVYAAPPLDPDDFKVENSVLTLCEKNPMYNFGLVSTHPKTQVGFSFFKGVLEYRFRIPRPRTNDKEAGEKGVPAVWSFPPDKITDETVDWVEPDWMEYWGDGYYTTTFHHEKREYVRGPQIYSATNWNGHRGPVAFTDGEWHTMTFLWEEGSIQSWLDGVPAVKQTYRDGEEPEPKVSVNKGEYDPDVYKQLNTVPQALILGGSWCNPLEIDWIRVWQK